MSVLAAAPCPAGTHPAPSTPAGGAGPGAWAPCATGGRGGPAVLRAWCSGLGGGVGSRRVLPLPCLPPAPAPGPLATPGRAGPRICGSGHLRATPVLGAPRAVPNPWCPVSQQCFGVLRGKLCGFLARPSLGPCSPCPSRSPRSELSTNLPISRQEPCASVLACPVWRSPGGWDDVFPGKGAPSQSLAPRGPFERLPRDTSHGCRPAGAAAASLSSPSPAGTSPPSRTERSAATPSPAKKRTTSVSAGASGCHGGEQGCCSAPRLFPTYRTRGDGCRERL